ncbi:MAG: hypothetical protein ABIE07_02395 [Candidatus Zixiibacteriota bacterium]
MMKTLPFFALMIFCISAVTQAQDFDLEDIIDGIYLRDSSIQADIKDLTISVEAYSRKLSGDGDIKEEAKFLKTYYFKDTLFAVKFLEYYKDGEKQSDEELAKQEKEAVKKMKKDNSRDAQANPIDPFYPEFRAKYRFDLMGNESKNGYECYHIFADCRDEDERLIEGDFWFEIDNLNLVETEFKPSKLPGPLKQLDMVQTRKPTETGYWLPASFYLRGRGKVMIFIKFNFEAEELYSDYKINTGLTDDIFGEDNDED